MLGNSFYTSQIESKNTRHRPTSSLTAFTLHSEAHSHVPLNRRIRRAFRMETVVHDPRWKRECLSTHKNVQL